MFVPVWLLIAFLILTALEFGLMLYRVCPRRHHDHLIMPPPRKPRG